MKLKEFFSALALAVLLATAAMAQGAQPNQANGAGGEAGPPPKLVIESFTHDFGEVKAGTPLRYSFKVKNEGKGELQIKNVQPG
jgi:hypothetical protein